MLFFNKSKLTHEVVMYKFSIEFPTDVLTFENCFEYDLHVNQDVIVLYIKYTNK